MMYYKLMFILFVDYGQKRSGMALGDSISKIVMPLEQFETKNLTNRIKSLIKEYNIEKIVWGIPVNSKDIDHDQTILNEIKNFAKEVSNLTALPYSFIDETLTTEVQKSFVNKKYKINKDVLSAMLIAEDYLSNQM